MNQSWYRHHHRIILLQSSDYDPDFTMKKLKIIVFIHLVILKICIFLKCLN